MLIIVEAGGGSVGIHYVFYFFSCLLENEHNSKEKKKKIQRIVQGKCLFSLIVTDLFNKHAFSSPTLFERIFD